MIDDGATPMDLLATGHVLRWHTTPTARVQTLADHIAKVALLADHLGRHLGTERYTPEVALETLRWGLIHDLPETDNGDIPTPAKAWLNRWMPEGVKDYDSVLACYWWAERHKVWVHPSDIPWRLVSCADLLEACCWYWTFGLVNLRSDSKDLRSDLVYGTCRLCRDLLPELLGPVCEVLSAAGIPEGLIFEASA